MKHFVRRQHRTQWVSLSLILVILLGSLPMGRADESAPPTAPGANPSDVQERAVIRGQRMPLEPVQVAPAPAKSIDKSTVGGQRVPEALLPSSPAPSSGPTGPLPVVGGTNEPDYKYPWVVRMNGCGAVLIDPQWVLTAAHCVYVGLHVSEIFYSRTDPYTGAVQTGKLAIAGGGTSSGIIRHPQYQDSDPDHAHDIALVKLEKPFFITPSLQTVGLPRFSRNPGLVGTVASYVRQDGTPISAGQVAIFRGPISALDSPTKIYVPANTAGASLCPGDSGSGFVTVEYGRAVVRGVASEGSVSNCMTPSGEAVFTDVFAYRDWILRTMGKNDASLSGNTRIRWGGSVSRGTMVVACFNPNGNLVGPLNVVGVEEGALCEAGQTQTVMCTLDKNQTATKFGPPTLSGLTMRTTASNGASTVQTIPASGNTASFFGLLPAGASREFTCQIGTPLTAATGAITGSNLAVMSRGVEGEQPMEPIVEQPSPFDQPEESK